MHGLSCSYETFFENFYSELIAAGEHPKPRKTANPKHVSRLTAVRKKAFENNSNIGAVTNASLEFLDRLAVYFSPKPSAARTHTHPKTLF